jgi:hypothetical protein
MRGQRYAIHPGALLSPRIVSQPLIHLTIDTAITGTSYLIVDYARSNFSIFQSVFPETNGLPEKIIPIYPPGTSSKHNLSRAVIIGIIVAPLVILVIALILTMIVIRRRRRAALESALMKLAVLSAPQEPVELDPMETAVELVGGEVEMEMEGEGRHELQTTGLFELSSENARQRPNKAQ